MSNWTPEQVKMLKRFAKGRIGVRKTRAGPDHMFATRYRPSVAGLSVVLSDTPEYGYMAHDDAAEAARKYRQLCRAALREAGDG